MAVLVDRFLDRALKIRPGEGAKVGLMALYAANAIGAVVVGRTVRDTLFLSSGATSSISLPVMYIINSIAVALLSSGYARIADGMRRDRLNSIVASGWAIVMLGFFGAALGHSKMVAPALYVAVEAMGALVVIQFWTFAQDIFTSREAKRLFSLISAGGQAANVVYGFLASSVSKQFGAEKLLILCAFNLVLCGFFAWYISRKFGTATAPAQSRVRGKKSAAQASAGSLRSLATTHIITIAVIGVVSAIVVNLVDFQFKAATVASFKDKSEMGAFFGKFYAVCGAVALALQMGVTSRILERFGLLASLAPLPIGLAVGSITAYFSAGGWAGSLAKGSDSIFRYTMNDASMQLLYVPVPQHQRGRAKALIDGILKPLAGVVAGLILVGVGAKKFTDQAGARPNGLVTALIVLLILAWAFALFRAKDEYVRSLLDTLQRRRLDLGSTTINADKKTADAISNVLRSQDALAILHAIELLPNVRGHDFGPHIAELLDHPVSSVRAAAADHLAEHPDPRYAAKLRERLGDRDPWCVASAIGAICALEKEKALLQVRPFLRDPRPAIRAAAVVGLVRNAGINGILEAADELKKQLNATSTVERELAASLLGALGVPTFYDALVKFLDDPSPNVRRAALVAAGRLKSPELVPYILKHLARRETTRDAAKALVQFGDGVEKPLGQYLHDPSVAIEIRRAIPTVLGRLGTKEAADILHSTLEANDPPLRAIAARALARIMRRRNDITVKRDVIMKAVNFEIALGEKLSDMQLALALPLPDRNAPMKLTRGEGAPLLLALALVEERDRAIQRAIVLLELLYPEAGLDVAADNLRSDSPARRANAIEVFDNTVQNESKKRLLTLMEDRLIRPVPTGKTRVGWLSDLVAGPHPWIAACAAQVVLQERLTGAEKALREGLRSSTPYVRETCANALAQLDLETSRSFLEPLREDAARAVRQLVERMLGRRTLATA
jgi:ATP/ADP translocase/HEAT repeat protein